MPPHVIMSFMAFHVVLLQLMQLLPQLSSAMRNLLSDGSTDASSRTSFHPSAKQLRTDKH